MENNGRGLANYTELLDTKQQRVRVQASSSAEEAVWIFCEHNKYEQKRIDQGGKKWCPHPHLDVFQALQVSEALLRFANEHSMIAVLKAEEMQTLKSFYTTVADEASERDEDYGYIYDFFAAAVSRITDDDATRLFRLSSDEYFIFERLIKHGTDLYATVIGEDETTTQKMLTGLYERFTHAADI